MDTTLKRRIVYMSDAEWTWLKEQAAKSQVTISSLVRGSIAWIGHNPAEMRSGALVAQVLEDADESGYDGPAWTKKFLPPELVPPKGK